MRHGGDKWAPTGILETAAGQALVISLGAPVQLSGIINYVLVN